MCRLLNELPYVCQVYMRGERRKYNLDRDPDNSALLFRHRHPTQTQTDDKNMGSERGKEEMGEDRL